MAWRMRLDSEGKPSHTFAMPETFLTFDFGADEETAQQARHQLEVWKQAFRLDKRVLFKFERGEAATEGKPKDKAASSNVKLLVRLYFSPHEKLTYDRWAKRIPSEQPFQSASPRTILPADAQYAATKKLFEGLE